MIKEIGEYIIETIAGKVVAIALAILLGIGAWILQERRNDDSHKQDIRLKEAAFLTEEENKKRDRDYENILLNPSIESIDAFTREYPNDKRLGKLQELKSEIARGKREELIWEYIHKNQRPSIDSLFVLKEISKDTNNIRKVQTLLMQRYYEETINQVELNKILEFESNFPNETEKIKDMYKVLEELYFKKHYYNRTHWSSLDYLKTIPVSLQRRQNEVAEDLKRVEETPLNISQLENKTYLSDPMSVEHMRLPMIFKFGRANGHYIDLTIIRDDIAYFYTRASLQSGNLVIDIPDNGVYHNFSTVKLYSRENIEFLESNYNSRNGFFRLNFVNHE